MSIDRDPPTVPTVPAVPAAPPIQAVPGIFPTELVPVQQPAASQAWSEATDPDLGQQPGFLPGWTGLQTLPPLGVDGDAARRQRRRRALLAVGGVALATAVVVIAALLIAPTWRSTPQANKDGQAIVSTGNSAAPPTSGQSAPATGGAVAPILPSAGSSSGAGSAAASGTLTVTVTATSSGAAKPSGTAKPSGAASTPKTTAPKPTPKPAPKPANPLGVPQRDIACSPGYIVQLASEIDTAAFQRRVAALKAAGQVPAGALAANSAKSCHIFSNQINTLVLYAGPFAHPYDGCAARLGGPADAFIKGANPASSTTYYSCLCPAQPASLPRLTKIGQQGAWVGELQRVLGNRLGISVGSLGGDWGVYTPATAQAVKTFQSRVHLRPNGHVDAATWAALRAAGC